MKNSIEENIKTLRESIIEEKYYIFNKDLKRAIKNLLSDYKRVLKENEEVHKENEHLHREINRRIKLKIENEKIVDTQFISIQKIKDKIEELRAEYEYLGEENKRVNKFEIELLQELIEDEINIDSIEEYKQEHTERCIDIDIRNKINELIQAVKQIDKRVKKLEG